MSQYGNYKVDIKPTTKQLKAKLKRLQEKRKLAKSSNTVDGKDYNALIQAILITKEQLTKQTLTNVLNQKESALKRRKLKIEVLTEILEEFLTLNNYPTDFLDDEIQQRYINKQNEE